MPEAQSELYMTPEEQAQWNADIAEHRRQMIAVFADLAVAVQRLQASWTDRDTEIVRYLHARRYPQRHEWMDSRPRGEDAR